MAYCKEKYQYFNGVKFTRDDKTGYYLNSTLRKRMHIYVYEFYNGCIPAGYEIHHKDFDRSNNDIQNLELLTVHEHRMLHAMRLTEEQKKEITDNLNTYARPKAIEWHKSDAGREWHKKHYESIKDILHHERDVICHVCGKEFKAMGNRAKYCSIRCKRLCRLHKNIS